MYLYLSSSFLAGTSDISFSGPLSSASSTDLYITVSGSYTLYAVCTGFAQDSVSATISANTNKRLIFTTQPSSGSGASNCPVEIKAADNYGNLLGSGSSTVYLTLDSSSAAFTTTSTSMSSGIATFSSCTVLGSGTYYFVASSSGYGSTLSNSFTVTQTLSTIAITAPVSTCYAGMACTVQVTLTDSNSDTFYDTGVSVTVTKSSGTGTISTTALSSFSAINTVDVTFSAGGSFTLSATCSGCSSTPTVTTASVTVSDNVFIDIKWPSEIQEGSTSTYQIGLKGITPTGTVAVSISSSDITIGTSSLSFSAVDSYQSVSVTVPYLSTSTNSYSATVTHSITSSGNNYDSATFTGCGTASDGTMTLPIYATNPTVTVDSQITIESLGSGTYQISLNVKPTSTVTVSLTASGSISLSSSSVSFTTSSWSAKSITVTSTSAVTSVSATATISHSISTSDSLYTSPVKVPTSLQTSVTIVISSYAGVTFTGDYLNLAYGESGTYTVKLKTQPTSSVTVAITDSSSLVTVSPTSLTFSTSAYSTAQTVTVTVSTAPSSVTALDYIDTITHTLTSSDSSYSGLVYETSVEIINTCEAAVYDWLTSSTCSATITNFQITSSKPVRCSPGYYYTSSTCTICPTGSYCPDGKSSYTCNTGTYASSTGSLYCKNVAAGYYWTSTTSSGTVAVSGQYTLPRTESLSDVKSCKSGNMCPYTTINADYKCPLGKYSSTAVSTCTTCAAGSSCTYSSTATCTNTYPYSPLGRNECFLCRTVFSKCLSSTITLLTEGNKISSNTISTCTSTKYCSVINNYQEASCPLGTYISSSTCVPCTSTSASYKCDGTGSSASTTTCSSPTYSWGLYCLGCPYPLYTSGSSCVYVPSGKYYVSSTSVSTCAAFYSAPGGYQTCDFCSPGYECASGSSKPTTSFCAALDICEPESTTKTKCPEGTYSDVSGKSNMNQCKVCSTGYTCAQGTNAAPSTSCPSAQFCPYGTKSTDSYVCIGGTYSSAASTKAHNSECTSQTLGKYAQYGGTYTAGAGYFGADLLTRSGCPYGTYSSSSSQDNVADCTSCSTYGFCPRMSSLPRLCPLGWTISSSSVDTCVRCASGITCAGSNLASSSACVAGYFCPRGNYYMAYKMIPGYFITGTAAVSEQSASECIAGFACAAGATSQTGSCSANYYCPAGAPSSTFFGCSEGKYTTNTNVGADSACDTCTAGNACMKGYGLEACFKGFICSAGTQFPTQFACSGGTYTSSTSQTSCTACTAGKYCPIAADREYSCPRGTYRASANGQTLTDCIDCPDGTYCGSTGSSSTTSCGIGNYCDSGATAPLPCKSGYYCSSATMSSTNMYASACPGGYLCPYGVSIDPTTDQATYGCEAGYYCLSKKTYAIPCRPGTYVSSLASDDISDCLDSGAGKYLDTYASTDSGTDCPAGYYCPSGTTQPVACPAGTYNTATGKSSLSDCTPCEAGYYCPYESTTTRTDCPQGSYCLSGSTSPTLCPVGTYGAATKLISESECTDCPAGKYCDAAGLTAVTGDCAAGYYCYLASITATPDGQTYGYLCPAGSYCEAGTASPQSCPAGTFNNYEGQVNDDGCIVCPEGFYCENAVDPYPSGPCTAGYFCGFQETTATPSSGAATVGHFAPGGTPDEIECPKGYYQDLTAQSSCKICDKGYYCPSVGMSTKTDCPVGFYCPVGCLDPIPCVPGTFNADLNGESTSDCAYCTAGKYCAGYGLSAVSGDCAAGFFCETGSIYEKPMTLVDTTNAKYGPCPKGYYCEAATTSRSLNPCPAGTYNPAQKGTSSSACLKCTAGRYCAGTANTNDDSICPEKYYCPESTATGTANPCTAGNFCAAGSDYEKPCFPGTYSDAAEAIECTDCPTGSYCERGTSAIDTSNACPAGYYCPINTFYDEQYPCPPGTFSASTGLTEEADCSDCTAGKYCEIYGISDLSARDCAEGFYCSGSADVSKPMDSSGYGGICEIGQFCPSGSSAAQECTAGKYCDKDQLAAVTGDCKEGHYCTLSATVYNPSNSIFDFGDTCTEGHYCVAGSSAPTACGLGKYLPYTGAVASSECIDCPPGYVCDSTGISFPTTSCPAGYYCPPGTSVGTTKICTAGHYCEEGSHEEVECESGTYQDSDGQSVCIACPAGKYCEKGATIYTDCPAGYYCPVNTGYRYSNPCSPGTFNPNTGESSVSACQVCTAGSYCYDEGMSAVSGDCADGYYCTGGSIVSKPVDDSSLGSVCLRGYYCPSGSSTYTTCDAGSYCISQGLSAVSGTCTGGYYCLAGSITPVPTDDASGNICPQGSHCEAGVGTYTSCPQGTFGAGKGVSSSSECTDCPYGYYCGTTGLTAPSSTCTAGYYCDGASTTATENTCAAGHYCPAGSFESIPCDIGTYQASTGQSSCLDCVAGLYCDQESTGGTDCPIGYYCPTGTRNEYEFPCPDGKFSSSTGQSVCTSCTAGRYCVPGSQDDSNLCPVYSYCPLGTGTPYICPEGTYNDVPGSEGLTVDTSCTDCPAGKYCVDGRISDDCEAGYLCTGGSPTPTPIGTNTYGSECPEGGFCEEGVTEMQTCPTGKFNRLKGGKSLSDCTDCPPGYYCEDGSTTPTECLAGYYCPQGVQSPTPCPVRTYNPDTLQDSENSCIVCPGGYLCTAEGVSNYTEYECGQIGAYCVAGAERLTPCPPGTYSNSTNAASIDDCNICTEGYLCPGGSDEMLLCIEGTFCPTGSSYTSLCLIGYYCPEGSPQSIKCPSGYYCPKYDYANLPEYVQYEGLYYNTTHIDGQLYLPCPDGYACPEGSFAPELCADGYYNSDNNCLACPAGTYSNDHTGCKVCSAGYICVLAATRPDPLLEDYQGGYICPSGYYCPAGAINPTPCRPGYYNPLSGSSSETEACILCPQDTYTDTYGNPNCLPCGSSAYSPVGSTTCSCTGSNRNYLKSDGTCRCIYGFEFLSEGTLISEQDGTEDCFEKVYPFQPKGQIRDPTGKPIDPNNCDGECGSDGGTVLDGVGVCQCKTVKSTDEYCNKACRDEAPKYSITGSEIYNEDTGEFVSLENLKNYYGSVSCSEGCQLYSMNMEDSGPEAVYGTGKALETLFPTSRRRLATSQGISNPVICVSINTTYIFSISKDHYPKYLKDSLLNTNPDFDYGSFKELDTLMNSQNTDITTFAYTFTQQGIYDFVDSGNSDKHVIISIIGSGQQCPDSDIPIRTRTTSSLLTLGTQSRTNIISDPDWVFIILTVLALIFIVILLILAVYLFEHHKWTYRFRVSTNYRDSQMLMDFESLTKPENIDSSSNDESGKESDKPVKVDVQVGVDEMVGNDDIDPTIFKHMQKLLEDQKHLAENTFNSRLNDGRNNMNEMLDKIAKIKKFLRESLEGLDDGEMSEEAEQEISPEQEVEKLLEGLSENFLRDGNRLDDTKRRLQEILQDPNLTDKDRRDLLNDFSANMMQLDQALINEQNKASELLSKRLLERQGRKKKQGFSKNEEEPVSFVASIQRKNTEKELGTLEEEKKIIHERIENDKAENVRQMREELSKNLRDAKSKREQDELMEDYNKKAKELEMRAQEDRERQEADLMRRLKNRKLKKAPLVEIENEEANENMPKFFQIEDQQKIELLKSRQEEVRQELYDRQEKEKIELMEDFSEVSVPIPVSRPEDKQKLELALKNASNEAEKKALMAQLSLFNSKPDNSGQKESLQAKLEERKRLRALKEAELKRKHAGEQMNLDDNQDDEIGRVTNQIAQEKIMKLVNSDLDPEELTKQIKEMIDEKQQIELDQLLRKKQEFLTQKQTDLLQDSLSGKADQMLKIRHEFRVKRESVELSAQSPMAKANELKNLEKQEADAITQLDYKFVNNLGKEQDKLWRTVEDEFRQRFLDLSDKHLAETGEMLRKLRELNPALLQSHLRQAEAASEDLKKIMENDYKSKLSELDSRQLEFYKMQGDREQEIDEIRRQLDEAEAKKKEMFEVERMRQEKQEKQKKMIEEMRKRGIRPEQVEEMIKKHQQENTEWEITMEKERLRQKEKMQEKLNERLAKHQERMAQKLAKFKEDNNKVVQASKEEDKLELKFPTGREELIFEPVKNIDTKLRVNPLPIFVRSTVNEYADYSGVLQTLLNRVKRIERMVATVDLDQFSTIMTQLENISSVMGHKF